MSNRALQISIGLSLAIHLIVSIALSGERWTATVVRPPAAASPVRVRLAGPSTDRPRAASPQPTVKAAPPRPAPAPAPRPEAETRPSKTLPNETPPIKTPPGESPSSEPAAVETAAVDVAALSSDIGSDGGAPGPSTPDRRPGPGSSNEDEEDRLARYVETIRARVQARKRYPPLARKRAVEGRVLARLAIRADGRLSTVEFEGDVAPLLRRATDDAIRSAEPYPAPPAGAITIELPVDYSLRDAS